MAERRVEPYSFLPRFERAVVLALCSKQRFYGRIGHALEPAAFSSEIAQLAVQAARAFARDAGHGPDDPLLVVQRLRSWVRDGKVTIEQVREVGALLAEATDDGALDDDSLAAELVPVVRRRMEGAAVRDALSLYAKRGDMDAVVDALDKARRVGAADLSVGVKLGVGSFADIDALRQVNRLPTGLIELDTVLDGGMPRGCEGVWLGGTGAGKSMALVQNATEALLLKFHVAYATLELPRGVVLARCKSNMTEVAVNSIIDGGDPGAPELIREAHAKAQERIAEMAPCFGTLWVQDFTAGATTIEDIFEWVERCEQTEGREVHVVVIDYADKLGVKGKKDVSGYDHGRIVYEGFRVFVHDRKKWGWTASQTKAGAGKKSKKVDTDDAADSQHKVRVADLVLSLNYNGEENATTFYIAKNRYGRAHTGVGPLPSDFSVARIAPVNRVPF